MKIYVRSNQTPTIIFEDENFLFKKVTGIGRNNTQYFGLDVQTKEGSLADKHVVAIALETNNFPKFEGGIASYTYSDVYVKHGMRMMQDTLDETEEYIAALEDAVDFARSVLDWIYENGYDEVNVDMEAAIDNMDEDLEEY